MSSPDSKNKEIQNQNSDSEITNPNPMTLSPKPSNNIINFSKYPSNLNPNPEILSPKTENSKNDNLYDKMELNKKFYPSKANIYKNEYETKHHSPRTSNSPIVNYYAGMGHPNQNNDILSYYSPEEEYNKKDNYNNYNINNNQYSNFNFSPSAIFDFGIKGRDSNSSLNNNSYNYGTTLQEKIEGNLDKIKIKDFKKSDSGRNSNNPNSSSGNSGFDEGEDNKDLYMLNFNSDEEPNENEENSNLNNIDKGDNNEKDERNNFVNSLEGNQFTLNISDDDEKISPLYNNNINNKFNIYNYDIGKKPLIGYNDGFIPPPTNMNNNKFIINQNNNNNNLNKSNNIENDNNTSNNNKQEPVINYYSNYFNNFYLNSEPSIQKKFPSIGVKFPSYNQDLFKNFSNENSQNEIENDNNQNEKNIEEPMRKIPSAIPRTSNSNKPRPITSQDLITTTTSNNKKIKRIDPNIYINENYEYLAYNIFALAKDQAGCRFLQKKIEDEPEESSKYFYPAILPYISSLVKDPFGNYLIQKLCPTLKPEQIKRILMILSTNILDIGSNSHGTRVLQNIINYLSTNELIEYFITIIRPSVVSLLKELNGTHIIQKLINDFPSYAPKIHKIIIDNCASLATHRHGCCVLQKYLDGSDKDLQKKLIDGLVENSLVLVIDQFGNYVIQSMLLLCDTEASEKLVDKLLGNITYYSKHKYSSNVVEKCFDYSDAPARKKLIDALNYKEIISDLIIDEHGNYVIQKVLANADSKTQNDVLNIIIENIPKIKEVSFGERIINRLIMTYPQMANMINLIGDNNYNIKVINNNRKGNNKGKYKKKNNNRDNFDNNNNNGGNNNNGKQNQKNYYK